jgi:hypothetical protein
MEITNIVNIILVLIPVAAFLAGVAVTAGFFSDIKKENERLNQKLQRNNPRDAHGRFTKDK